MTIEQAKEICENLSALASDTFNIPVLVNGRLTRSLGRCISQRVNGKVTPTKIEISQQLLETATYESIKSVVEHEWVHYYVTKITGEKHGHDAVFKHYCSKFGVTNDGCSTEVERTVEVKSKYEIFCRNCGALCGKRSRACQLTKFPHNYSCGSCNGPLMVIQNF